ncbi:MAG TPA: hypothetical protein VFY29_00720 [Terriglobia bacterium]|nr:hypothetical protein [Terriglobia bacterium]
MARFRVLALVAAMALVVVAAPMSFPSELTDQSHPVTFNKDVLPVLEKNCQTCHRPGEIAPMSFLSYESTRPFAKAIKSAVLSKQMPPWFADAEYGEFRNSPKLTNDEIKTLVAWADTGAAEGNPLDRIPTRKWEAEGWRTKPDVVVSMPQAFRVPAQGAGEIREFFIPNPFKEDTWVRSIEIRPGNTSVVHHVILQVADQTRDAQLRSSLGSAAALSVIRTNGGVVTNGFGDGASAYSGISGVLSKLQELKTGQGSFMTMEAVYAPGTTPIDFRYSDSAKLIHGGGQLRIEVHYTPNGKETLDQTKIGFTLAKEPVKRSFVLMAPEHMVDPRKPIPAGDTNWETTGEITFSEDAELAWFMPHMHLRGKDMTFQLIYPDGRMETVLSARFNFNWQLGYEVEKPIKIPKGTKMVVTAHHDNSANNKANPNPSEAVVWGDLTGQEMMVPWFGVIVNRDSRPETIASYRPRDLVLDDTLRALDRMLTSGDTGMFAFE